MGFNSVFKGLICWNFFFNVGPSTAERASSSFGAQLWRCPLYGAESQVTRIPMRDLTYDYAVDWKPMNEVSI